MELSKQKTHPCGPEIPPLKKEEVEKYLNELNSRWEHKENKISRIFKFNDFVEAMQFVNSVAAVAEEANHHPNIAIFYNKVTLTLWTHAIKGLSLNDFIVAAKINNLLKK